MSDLVVRDTNLIFSNNRNEFYSINIQNGLINWQQKINSNIRPVFYNDFIFTVSNEGYFFVIDKITGNIIRVTDVFNVFKIKKERKFNQLALY